MPNDGLPLPFRILNWVRRFFDKDDNRSDRLLGIAFVLLGGFALYLALGFLFGWVKPARVPTLSPEEMMETWALVMAGGFLVLASGVALMFNRKWPFLLMGVGSVALASLAFSRQEWYPAFQGTMLGIFDIAKGLGAGSRPKPDLLADAKSFKNLAELDRFLAEQKRLRKELKR